MSDTIRYPTAITNTQFVSQQAGLELMCHRCEFASASSDAMLLFALQALTHPMDVVKKRYQVSGLQRSLAYGQRVDAAMTSSLRGCIAHIWRHEGAAGFYKGISPSLLKVCVPLMQKRLPIALLDLEACICALSFVVWSRVCGCI
jgi:hypothetical protein